MRVHVRVVPFLCLGAALQAQIFFNQPIQRLAVDSSRTNPAIFATTGPGLFVSRDGGANWRALYIRPANNTQPLLSGIVPDPVDAQTIYVSTESDDGAVWKTTDSGATWRTASDGLPRTGQPVEMLTVHPATPRTLFARIGNQIFRSENGGDSWTLHATSSVTILGISRSSPRVIFGAFGNTLLYSDNEGVLFRGDRGLELALQTGGIANAITAISVDPANADIVWVGVTGSTRERGVYRSTNAGLVFTQLLNQNVTSMAFDWTRSVVYAVISPQNLVVRSIDGGRSWTSGTGSPAGRIGPLGLGLGNPETAWLATTAGPYSSSNRGERWDSRGGAVRPTVQGPAIPLDFVLPPNATGRVSFPVVTAESDAWSVPISVAASPEPWLSLLRPATTTPSLASQVVVNTQGMAPGNYSGSIRITAPQASNGEAEVPVRLLVRAPEPPLPYTIDAFAGTGAQGRFGDGGAATQAGFTSPDSLTLEPPSTLYVSDPGNQNVRKIAAGIINRSAGTGTAGNTGDGGSAQLATLRQPRGIATDAAGGLLIADTGNNRIRRVAPEGDIQPYAPVPSQTARGMARDKDGNLFLANTGTHSILRLGADGSLTRVAGNTLSGDRGDGADARNARLSGPADVTVDPSGSLYIADTENNRVRQVLPDGRIRTVAGNGLAGFQGDADDATATALNRPTGVAVGDDGSVYIADTENHRIRRVTPDGKIRTIAGTGAAGFNGDGGPAAAAVLRAPGDVVLGPQGVVYFVDTQNNRIRRLTPPPPPLVPRIADGGVTNPADESRRLTPGGLFRITGANLAKAEATSPDGDWPLAAGGVAVSFGGLPAALATLAPGQLTGQVPHDLPAGPVAVSVTLDGQKSNDVSVEVVPAAPNVFLINNEDGARNSSDAPAPLETTLTVFLTGIGAVSNPPPPGKGPSPDLPSTAVLPASARFGEAAAEAEAPILLPGFVSVAQMRVKIPAGVTGESALVVTIGEAASAPVPLWIVQP